MDFPNLANITVLLVEPEPETRAFYVRQLNDTNINVVELDNPEAMAGAVNSHAPDVVVINPSLNLQKTLKVLSKFKHESPHIPVITMTKTMPDDTLDAIMQTGVSLHINRELTRPRDLLLALDQILTMK